MSAPDNTAADTANPASPWLPWPEHVTEAGFVLLDAHFARIAPGLSHELKAIPGVLESGLFEGYAFEPCESVRAKL